MRIVSSANDLAKPGRRACLAIGFFDGVHLGHQQIIRQAGGDAQQQDAASVVVTFEKHPASVVAPERAPFLIQTLNHRLRAIDALGPDAALLLRFDTALREQPGDAFIRRLHRELGGICSICIGADFHFGFKRSGNVALLQQLGAELGFQVHGIGAVALGGRTISSTRIREAIGEGHFQAASEMLGRAYGVASRVVHGDHLGRKLGFPTANLDVSDLVLPPNGVYVAQATALGKRHHAVVNIGNRPTITPESSTTRLEAHLLDFDGSLYDEELELVFVDRLRGEQRFGSREELQQQIQLDVTAARQRFG